MIWPLPSSASSINPGNIGESCGRSSLRQSSDAAYAGAGVGPGGLATAGAVLAAAAIAGAALAELTGGGVMQPSAPPAMATSNNPGTVRLRTPRCYLGSRSRERRRQ